jgi:predicted molibdopterin-dependent oxidoreductase YjgC
MDFWFRMNPFADDANSIIFDDMWITYIEYETNGTSKVADFVFPVKTIFEQTGTFGNKNYILKKIRKQFHHILEVWESAGKSCLS